MMTSRCFIMSVKENAWLASKKCVNPESWVPVLGKEVEFVYLLYPNCFCQFFFLHASFLFVLALCLLAVVSLSFLFSALIH